MQQLPLIRMAIICQRGVILSEVFSYSVGADFQLVFCLIDFILNKEQGLSKDFFFSFFVVSLLLLHLGVCVEIFVEYKSISQYTWILFETTLEYVLKTFVITQRYGTGPASDRITHQTSLLGCDETFCPRQAGWVSALKTSLKSQQEKGNQGGGVNC